MPLHSTPARVQGLDPSVIESLIDQRKTAKEQNSQLHEQLAAMNAALTALATGRDSDRSVLDDLARRRTEADQRILALQAELGQAQGDLVLAHARIQALTGGAGPSNVPTAPAPVSLTTTLAAKPPKVFTGVGTDGPKLRSWKTAMKAFLNATKVPEQDWTLTAVTYLSDVVQDQWAKYCESKPPGLVLGWSDLTATLDMWYSDDDPTTGDIMRALSLLRQKPKEPVAEYVQRFEHKATELVIPLDPEFEFDLMIGGMREPLKGKLQFVKAAMQRGFWKSVKDFRESATRFENLLRQQEQTQKDIESFTDPPPRSETSQAKKPWMKTSKSPKPLSPSQVKKKARTSDSFKPNIRSKIAKRQKLRDEGRCFICSEKGHLAKDCPQKKEEGGEGSSQNGRAKSGKQSFQ